ncbi:hypothetical protein [Azospirillum sp. TSO22-1]|uniref:hypothetical protein n=1 Tax=Azospirillum sp. TSO22-1 TaxID=716789 RepID=UPI000D604003|nr:hypothetical protein [Azospirillum sp. TSO22-1]PWC42119.1 hypothetical protein TSO221_22290 [Azospirillum sp. TSO22-1]
MIDIDDAAIVAERRASDGRFLLFTDTDLPAGSLLPWSSVMADIYGDGAAFLVRFDEATGPEGFTLLDLLDVVARRAAEEAVRRPRSLADRMEGSVRRCIEEELARRAAMPRHDRFGLEEAEPTPEWPYRLAGAWAGDNAFDLCRDPAGRSEGITVEQALLICEQACADATARLPEDRHLVHLRVHLAEAIRCEAARAEAERADAPQRC